MIAPDNKQPSVGPYIFTAPRSGAAPHLNNAGPAAQDRCPNLDKLDVGAKRRKNNRKNKRVEVKKAFPASAARVPIPMAHGATISALI